MKNVLCVPGMTVDAASLPLCLRPLGKKDALCLAVSVHKFVTLAVETLTRDGLMEGAENGGRVRPVRQPCRRLGEHRPGGLSVAGNRGL